jgi:hypothetical protein
MTNQIVIAIIAVVVIVALALGVWFYRRNRESQTLRSKFGPEYERLIRERGDRTKAEAELKARKERVRHLNIVPLSQQDSIWFSDQWQRVQGRFVDSPGSAVGEADRLVTELMRKRGYPTTDFENQAADLSVDYPGVVSNYRAAHEIAVHNGRGIANTEDLRQALVHYRFLFNELLETPERVPEEVRR